MTHQTVRYDNTRTGEVIYECTRDDKITEEKRGEEKTAQEERGEEKLRAGEVRAAKKIIKEEVIKGEIKERI